MASGEDRAPTTVSNNPDQALEEGSSQEQQASQEQSGEDRAPTTVSNNPDQALEEGSSQEQQALQEQDPHEHGFAVKFKSGDTYDIDCEQPCTVLEALKTLDIYKETFKDLHVNVIIQMGTGDDESIVPTHFPCSCIRDGEVLTISDTTKPVEKAQDVRRVHPKDYYSVFYIDTKGGPNVISTKLFKNTKVEMFKYICVYGEKEISVEEALKRDGRFTKLGNFELININDKHKIQCTHKIKKLHNKKFKICRSRRANTKTNQQKQQNPPHESTNAERQSETSSTLEVEQKGKIAIKEASSDVDTNKIYELLREQFPDLKRLMENRFTGDSFQKELNLRKENFGKIQKSFSEVHRVRKLLELGKSVCKVIVKDVSVGTGFVLFDNFILTSAHLFNDYVKEKKLQQDVEVFAIFDYEKSEPETNFYYFRAENTFIDFDAELDYAVLELNPEGSKPNQQTKEQDIEDIDVPSGLLSEFGPLPTNGEACIIGHPAGRVKEMDPTFIIETEKRGQAASDYLSQYKHPLIINMLSDHVRKQGIENILQGGHKAGKVGTYHTFMYHGASGSPVFDGLGRVFGLHTAGFTYGFTKEVESVIEYAHPLIMIFERFVNNLNESKNVELRERVKEEAKGNKLLTDILDIKQEAPEEQMEVSH